MNKIFFSFIMLSFFFCDAQAPSGINYQAAVRDADGILYDNQNVKVYFRLVVLETGNIVWEETHDIQTNEFGVFNTIIGFGESTSLGTALEFEEIDWSEGSMYVKVDVDFDNEGPQSPVSFGESQLLSVPYALYANSSGNHYWSVNDGVISPQDENLSINLSATDTQILSDFIEIGHSNSVVNTNSEIHFFNNNNLTMEIADEEINTYVQINSVDPINPSHLVTKNYVDSRDDDIVLQMNNAFEENINFFQNQINTLDGQVIDLAENVNQNTQAYYTLQDVLSANDQSLQDQVDLVSSILQTLEDNINTNVALQNQVDDIQIQINNLSIIIEELQEIIIGE
tara:strand:+ start:195 stop:1217 length:1023 start_codon:yes stop_codon:yes gene_type:complete